MKQVSLIAFLIVLSYSVWAQDDIADCERKMANRKPDTSINGRYIFFDNWKTCALDKKIPSFKLVTLNGDTINSKQIEGKVVVLNFWFIDCHPCIAEVPGMNKLVAEYKNSNVEFLAITRETIKRLKEEFLTKYKLDFKIIPGAEKYISKVIASGYPTTFILDAKGIIREAWNGGRIDDNAGDEYYETAKPVIDRLLKAQ